MIKGKRRITKSQKKDWLFVLIMLLYPVLQFVIVWAFVNIGSLVIAFQQTDIRGNTTWSLVNFKYAFDSIFHSTLNTTGISGLTDGIVMIINSLGYAVITIFVSIPLSMIFAYFLSKEMPFAGVFRVIFFLPNVIPVVALTMAYNMPLKPNGYIYEFLNLFGKAFDIYNRWPTSQLMVYVYCVWAGLGYNIILLSAAIGRIPKEIFESAKIDGVTHIKEFFMIVVPLSWPTIVTLIVVGLTNVLTLYLQPYLLTNGTGRGSTWTIAMEIFSNTSQFNPINYNSMAAKGLMLSLVWAPIVLGVRRLLSNVNKDVDF